MIALIASGRSFDCARSYSIDQSAQIVSFSRTSMSTLVSTSTCSVIGYQLASSRNSFIKSSVLHLTVAVPRAASKRSTF